MRKKTIKIGIMPFKQYQKYTMAIACGKYVPKKNEPKIWFETIETCMQVLSTKNIELLKLIAKEKPASIEALAKISGRNKSNLSRTLKNFQRHSLVDLIEEKRKKRPIALATQFQIEMGKEYPAYLFDEEYMKNANSVTC